MKWSSISDIHISYDVEESIEIFKSFAGQSKVRESEIIFLLGDIFDLMAGHHDEYFKRYPFFFNQICEWIREGKKIYYLEGNHDVHLKNLFNKLIKKEQIAKDRIYVSREPVILNISNEVFYFSHGDEHNLDEIFYHRYMKVLCSRPMQILADYLMPLRLLDFLGKKASSKSRKKRPQFFTNQDDIIEKCWRGIIKNIPEANYIIGGHTHLCHLIQKGHQTYLNSGFSMYHQSFIHFDSRQVTMERLN